MNPSWLIINPFGFSLCYYCLILIVYDCRLHIDFGKVIVAYYLEVWLLMTTQIIDLNDNIIILVVVFLCFHYSCWLCIIDSVVCLNIDNLAISDVIFALML